MEHDFMFSLRHGPTCDSESALFGSDFTLIHRKGESASGPVPSRIGHVLAAEGTDPSPDRGHIYGI